MAVPDFQSFMLPLLKTVSDEREHSLGEMVDALAAQFGRSEADQKELLPSGRKPDHREEDGSGLFWRGIAALVIERIGQRHDSFAS